MIPPRMSDVYETAWRNMKCHIRNNWSNRHTMGVRDMLRQCRTLRNRMLEAEWTEEQDRNTCTVPVWMIEV